MPLALGASAIGWLTQAARGSAAALRSKISVRDYGAKGDGHSNASQAIQAAIDDAVKLGGADVFLPTGVYVANGLRLYGNVRLIGDDRDKTSIRERTGNGYLLSVNPGAAGSADVSQNEHDIEIAGIGFDGPVESMGFSEHRHLLNFNGVTRLFIHDCAVRGFRGDGIYLGSSNVAGIERHNLDVRISKTQFDGINADNRNGISVIDGSRIRIDGNYFVRCSRRNMPGPVDVEPNGNWFQRTAEITIEANTFEDCGGGGGRISVVLPTPGHIPHPARNFRIVGNVIAGNQRSGLGIFVRTLGNRGADHLPDGFFATDFKIMRNSIGWGGTTLKGIAQFSVEENRFKGGKSALILGSLDARVNERAQNGLVARNIFEEQRGGDGALVIGLADGLLVSQNRFLGSGSEALKCAIEIAASDSRPLCRRVSVDENVFSNSYRTHVTSAAAIGPNGARVRSSNRTLEGDPIRTFGVKVG